jgi:hypothetical protein
VDALANIEMIKKIAQLITEPGFDFNVQSDAFETFKAKYSSLNLIRIGIVYE